MSEAVANKVDNVFAYAQKMLGWQRRALLLPTQRRYQQAPLGLAVPLDLVRYPYIIINDDCMGSDQVNTLFNAYPIEHVLQIHASGWQVWSPDGPIDMALADLRRQFGCRKQTNLQTELQRWSARTHFGCADQDWLAKQLQVAYGCLISAGMQHDQALTALATLLLGLVAGEPLPAQFWLQPEQVINRLCQRATAVDIECSAVCIPPLGTNVLQLASCLAPGRWQEMAWDLLGPVYTADLAAGLRRQHGVYFTPPELVDLCLDTSGVLKDSATDHDILDPCAGTGAFIVRLLARVRIHAGREGLAKYIPHLWAIEQDAASARVLALNVAIQWAASCDGRITPVPEWHLLHGDALQTYADFSPVSDSSEGHSTKTPEPYFTWRQKRDFAYVLGNPPYVGESGHRSLFAPYRAHPFWRRFSEAKMDFLQYFIVLGLSKIQDYSGGKLCFLTSSYWLTADGAARLRNFVLTQAQVQQVLYLRSEQSLFGDAPGHHNVIFLLERCASETHRHVTHTLVREYQADSSSGLVQPTWEAIYSEPQASLQGRPWQLMTAPAEQAVLATLETYPPLSYGFTAKQGVVPGAQRIGQADLIALGETWIAEHDIRLGEGVYTLTAAEVAKLNLPPQEQRFLRPFVKCSAIKAYDICPDEPLWLIYLRHDAVRPADCPCLLQHLARFRPLLTRKREYKSGQRDWFHLHWPREEAVFTGEKLLTAGRAKMPAFAWSAEPVYAATDVYFIVVLEQAKTGLWPSLLALEGILNSDLAWFWFAHRTKDKGEQREFFSTALQAFPLPVPFDVAEWERWLEVHIQLEKLLQRIHALEPLDNTARAAILHDVNEAVFALYQLAPEQESVIRRWLARERP